jgi:hypothetical protein
VDDYWVSGATQRDADEALCLLRAVLASLGMATPESKVQRPAQQVTYLGFTWTTASATPEVAITEAFVAKARSALAILAEQALWRKASVRTLVSSVRSMMLWLARIYAEGRAFLRGFGRALYAPPWAGRTPLAGRRVLADLTFWVRFLAADPPRRPIARTGKAVRVASDAGEGGLGVVVEIEGSDALVCHVGLRPWMPPDSTSREVLAACVGIALAHERLGEPLQVTAATDSAAAAFLLTGGSSSHAHVSAALARVARCTWDPGGTLVATWAPRSRTSGMDAVAASAVSAQRWASLAGLQLVAREAAWVDTIAQLPPFDTLGEVLPMLQARLPPSPCAGSQGPHGVGARRPASPA